MNKTKVIPASFQDLSLLHYPSFFWRDGEKEKGLRMMPGMTLFSFKKVGHSRYI